LDLSKIEDDAERTAHEATEKESKDLLTRIKKVLGDKVEDVRVSHRLKDSPACLVLKEHDMALHMQQLMKQAGHEIPTSKPTLEINPAHPVLERLQEEKDEQRFSNWSHVLLDQAALAEGVQLDDPVTFVHRLNELLLAFNQQPAS
jgi:molecular chaperone HtpG